MFPGIKGKHGFAIKQKFLWAIFANFSKEWFSVYTIKYRSNFGIYLKFQRFWASLYHKQLKNYSASESFPKEKHLLILSWSFV